MERFPDELNEFYEDIRYYTRKSTDTLVCTCVHKKSKKKVWLEWLCSVDECFEYFYKRFRIWLDLLDHPCIPRLYYVHLVGKYVYVVREVMAFNLKNLIEAQTEEITHIKYIMYQLFRLFSYMHSANVICMTLRPVYIGIHSDCGVKLLRLPVAIIPTSSQDTSDDHEQYDNLGHSAPELLFGTNYPDLSPAMNMWTIGVILAGLFDRNPLFQGISTMNTLKKIMDVLGLPTEQDLIDIKSPYATEMVNGVIDQVNRRDLKEILPNAPDDALDLLRRLLTWSPKNRLTAAEALKHPFLAEIMNGDPFIIEMNQYTPNAMNPPTMTVPSDNEILNRILSNPNYHSEMIKEINNRILYNEMYSPLMNIKVVAMNIARSSEACNLLPIELWQKIFASMDNNNTSIASYKTIAKEMYIEYRNQNKL